MTETKLPSNLPRKLPLIFLGLVVVLILPTFIIISLVKRVKEGKEADKIPIDASFQVRLVYGFPELPVYPGTILKSSDKEGQGDEARYRGVWEVKDSVPEVMNWYAGHLGGSGWKIEVYPADFNAQEVQFLVARNENLILNLSVIRQNKVAATEIVAEFFPPVKEDNKE